MSMARPPVETISGEAPEVLRGIEGDFAMLASARDQVVARTWTCPGLAVVLGVSRDASVEIDEAECARRGAAVLRRASGGGTVAIGDGTLQYAFALPHGDDAPPSLDDVKRAANAWVAAALASAGVVVELARDASGDLVAGDRKVGGVALRRVRHATLLHGTLLVEADLEAIAAVLRHPAREPAWRRGRGHLDFLANLGAFDTAAFAREAARLARRGLAGPAPRSA